MSELDEISSMPSKFAWLSALIDGEGCLSIYFCKQKTSPNPAIKIFMSISSINYRILEIAKEICNGGNIQKKKQIGNRKISYVYNIPTGTTRRILPKLNLIIKERQKEILLESLSLIGITPVGGYHHIKRSNEIENKFINLKNQLHILNRRGLH